MQGTLGKSSEHGLSFWHRMVNHGPPKRSENSNFSRRIVVLYTFPGICRRSRPKVLSQTPKNAFVDPRSYSKGPNHALEKVLTNETPCCGFLGCHCDTFESGAGSTSGNCGMISIGSGKSVETSPGFGSQGVPRTLCINLWSYHCSSPRLQLVSGALSVVNALAETRQLNSPRLTLQTHVGSVAIVRLTFVEK